MPLLFTTYLDSPFGYWEIQGSALGISRVRKVPISTFAPGPVPDVLKDGVSQLAGYFRGQIRTFDLKLDFGNATPFHRAVWNALLEIPYGHTTSYLAIAAALGNPRAVRAVGQANARNPVAIIVPCHRCIAGTGNLQGYFYGLDLKRALLEFENPASFARQGNLF
ncbi:MAG: methylated-DNA--[protein]-cysteine S-methyltransferase [Saprospiraceae bacterium]|jgi:methylated-DNA-[protein]-cysteine S-methyltransferase